MTLFFNNKKFSEHKYNLEEDFEKLIAENSKLFFGEKTIYIDAKKKIDTKALGGAIPDGFLFDFSVSDSPEFYLIEVELASHDFYRHIFPQITKFFAFFKNNKSQRELIEKIYSVVSTDEFIKKEFRRFLGEKEIYKFINDTIEGSQNILLVIDGDKAELPEIVDTYTDTWGKLVKTIKINVFKNSTEQIFSMSPDFENIDYSYIQESQISISSEDVSYSEEYHLDGVNDNVKDIYYNLKDNLLKINSNLIFNPQKYYVSIVNNRNVSYFKFRKKKIGIVVMLPFDDIKKIVINHSVRQLSEGVQGFYNGPCAEVEIFEPKLLEEIITLLKPLVTKE